MSYQVDGTTITLTRGDTFKAYITLTNPEGDEYITHEGDSMRFALKRSTKDEEPLLVKDIPMTTRLLQILPDETKALRFGTYYYDIELTTALGEVDTFITKSKFVITEEVH